MRNSIDHHPERLKKILMEVGVRKSFLSDARKQESKAVKAFVASNAGNALKTKPKGYSADHKDIELLRLRNYTIGSKLTGQDVTGADGMDRVVGLMRCMKPFIMYLNSVVMPDEGPSEDDESASTAISAEEESS
ncbi:hypothetical protein LTR91_017141 [Friedmanniomyces endolithicus]|uniref:Uncharacterized protein n=1 Tax=Friedmanniomyces endolithicus TaxID=329885 RepID=A0AAN6JE36_9PEZI|nr:hypothetical protein LTS09_007407 [Friedmanniomyces endolithicus]KAK0326308.1 hypothetical protein LTR82_003055 [Friedmanniomyces endolithicus]KAK0829323.1 hypothetical protein LTR73_004267 [Friedmanniomyces endolithicus]KAK0967416.1 hypothetical protein LTR91_017141 [Friedmanniomyces endolithicus]